MCINLYIFCTTNKNLFRYHNREAVVISALQVEKHPLTTPGPFTPPVQRSFHTTAMALSAFNTPPSSNFGRKSVHHLHGDHLTIASSSNGSPIPMRPQSSSSFYTTATTYGSPRFGEQYKSSPKPHSSPKMKLRLTKHCLTSWMCHYLFTNRLIIIISIALISYDRLSLSSMVII